MNGARVEMTFEMCKQILIRCCRNFWDAIDSNDVNGRRQSNSCCAIRHIKRGENSKQNEQLRDDSVVSASNYFLKTIFEFEPMRYGQSSCRNSRYQDVDARNSLSCDRNFIPVTNRITRVFAATCWVHNSNTHVYAKPLVFTRRRAPVGWQFETITRSEMPVTGHNILILLFKSNYRP